MENEKIGRNDPCPCGSGKKYKNCCLKKEQEHQEYLKHLDVTYGKLYSINHELIEKSNNEDYSTSDFFDAANLTLTSNMLSIIKSVINGNYIIPTTALNLRNTIECLVLGIMHINGDISKGKEILFKEQYKLIEYNLYKDKKELSSLLDFEELTKKYNEAKEVFKDAGISESKLEKLCKTRVPFLCDTKMNFNKLIEKYIPDLSSFYSYLSIITHSTCNINFIVVDYYSDYLNKTISLVDQMFTKYAPTKTTDYTIARNLIMEPFFNNTPNSAKILYDDTQKQIMALENIAKDIVKSFGDNIVSDLLLEISKIIDDLITDSLMSLCENDKIKVKVVFEILAVFNKIYFDEDNSEYNIKMFNHHNFYLNAYALNPDNNEQINTKLNDVINNAYNDYINIYPNGVDIVQFEKVFRKTTGNFIDEHGTCPTISSVVDDFLREISTQEYMKLEKPLTYEYLTVLYYESNAMSHGSGYLYFANRGAWSDDIPTIESIDFMINYLLEKIEMVFDFANETHKLNHIIKSIDNNINVFNSNRLDKMRIFALVPRIQSPF